MFSVGRAGTGQIIAQVRGADAGGNSVRLDLFQRTFTSGSDGAVNASEQDAC